LGCRSPPNPNDNLHHFPPPASAFGRWSGPVAFRVQGTENPPLAQDRSQPARDCPSPGRQPLLCEQGVVSRLRPAGLLYRSAKPRYSKFMGRETAPHPHPPKRSMVNRFRHSTQPGQRSFCYAALWHEFIFQLEGYHRGLYINRYKGRWGNCWGTVSVLAWKF
jgi:hypothetical protein